jgi:hypothetical protein
LGLDFVDPSKREAKKLNALLYGEPGTGKTTGACSAPGPIFYANAEGSARLYSGRDRYPNSVIDEFPIKGIKSLSDSLSYLLTDEAIAKYRTVAFDTVGEAYSLITQEKMDAKNYDMPSEPMYGESNIIIERWCRVIRDSPYNFVVVCHQGVDQDTLTGKRFIAPETGGRKNPRKLAAMMDIVAYTSVFTKKDGSIRYVSQMHPEEGRVGKCDTSLFDKYEPTDVGLWIRKLNGEVISNAD